MRLRGVVGLAASGIDAIGSRMHQRDYILRMIEQVGTVLKALLRRVLAREAEPGEARAELQKVLGQVGFDLDIALVADTETLVRMIAPAGELEPARGWLVAEAMYLTGIEAVLDDRADDARLTLGKALRLYRLFEPAVPIPTGFPEAAERIRDIDERLRALESGTR